MKSIKLESIDKRAGNLLSDYEIVWFVTWKSEKLNVITYVDSSLENK